MSLYNRIIKKPWPYWVGGILLGIFNVILLTTTGQSWTITTGFLYFGAHILNIFGLQPSDWYYFRQNTWLLPGETFIRNYYTVLNLAVILGSLIAVLWASEFKWKKIKNKKQLFFGFLGGILMGYGTRLSFGCNIGAYFSAIPSFSLHGWVTAVFMLVGAWIGCKVLLKYIL
ncbi:MAG: uncharacterized protein PWP27_2047 [Clostridiales bacterium]|nr:uncharacterized protein [Clostridiales bacterium]